jgi:hypothetical protein
MRAALVGVALCACASAAAAEEGTTALFDLRPVEGEQRETRLDALPEALAWTGPLGAAVVVAGGGAVKSGAELQRLVGGDVRRRVFDCRERPICLRPLFVALARRGVRRAVYGRVRMGEAVRTVAVYAVDLASFEVRRVTFEAPVGEIDAASLVPKLASLFGRAPAEPETKTKTKTPTTISETKTNPETKSAEPPPETGDVVETIDSDGAPASSAAAAPPPAPPSLDRFQVGGWVRSIFEFGFYTDGYHAQRPDALQLRYDPFIMRSQLLARTRYSRGRWLEITTSGALAYSFYEENPADPDSTFNLFNGQRTRAEFDPTLLELYVGFFTRRFDLRVGQQRIVWGRADARSPNDVINAHDLRDPLLADPELRNLPTPLVRGDVDLGFGSLQLVVAPFFLPDRFDVYGTNWAILQPDAPAPLRGLFNLISRGVDPSLQAAAQPLLEATRAPRLDLASASAGLRFSWTWRRLDVSHSYHYGYDPIPLLRIDPTVLALLSLVDFNQAGFGTLAPALQLLDMGRRPLDATYQRRHHVGLDAVTIAGPFALRLDAAFDSTRVFYRRDLNGITSPTLEMVLSVEYQTGDPGKFLIVEGIYLHLFDRPQAPLLFYSEDTGAIAVAFRWTFARRVQLGVRGQVGIQPLSYTVMPEVGLRFSSLLLQLGAVILGGEDFSFGSYFRRNNEVYVLAKYAF